MRLAFYIAVGLAAVGVAYAMGPDLARYLKIRTM